MRQRIRSGAPMEPAYGYCRAVRDGRHVAVSATAAIWPDGEVDPDVAVQTRRSLEIIEQALREAGATLADVVRTRIFMTDSAYAQEIGLVHGDVFRDIRPASGMIVVTGFVDPRWKVEIEADALIRE